MASTALFLFLVSSPALGYERRASSRKVPALGFYNPVDNGGSWLTQVNNTYPLGQGEPVNTVISGNSDDAVLVDSQDNGGLRNYFQSLGFSSECLGQTESTHQAVNLGDGNGYLNETAVIRWNYGDPQLGTCKETIEGGDHFRYWTQDGSQADSGAIFMAVSYEEPLEDQHDIIPDGYNLGRDWLIGNITHSTIPSLQLTNGSTYSGTTSANNYTYQTDIIYLSGYLQNTSYGINHNLTVAVNGVNASDGLVALLTVKITGKPQTSS
ncbi:hypothetical protein H0H92_016018 [Tricholoma furcatifolium]|nr:hypothetical protein H0H92_016018 [Tricholoma furcatifolium]